MKHRNKDGFSYSKGQWGWCHCIISALLLTGCSLNPGVLETSSKEQKLKRKQSLVLKNPVVGNDTEQTGAVPGDRVSHRDEDVRQLLKKAWLAVEADKLTTPVTDNAFDRFQAVLLLKPGHKEALAGVETILKRYIALTERAVSQQSLSKARLFLGRARGLNANDDRVKHLGRQVSLLASQLKRSNSRYAGLKKKGEYPLAVDSLEQRSDGVIEQLKNIAEKAQKTKEFLLIVARSDAEGRWIYQQMRKAVPGFLLRGDIKLGNKPKVMFLPAVE